MQETLKIDHLEYTAAVHHAEGEHVAEWRCGECQIEVKTLDQLEVIRKP